MGTPKVTPPEGLHPDSLPPDFDGWDDPIPTHPAGQVTAYDERSGLPIVRRKAAESAADTTAKPADKEAEPAKEETPKAETALAKGVPVTLPDGSKGKVAHVIQGMGTVRVRTEDGRNLTVRARALQVVPHTMVTAHARKLPGK